MIFKKTFQIIESLEGFSWRDADGNERHFFAKSAGWTRKLIEELVASRVHF